MLRMLLLSPNLLALTSALPSALRASDVVRVRLCSAASVPLCRPFHTSTGDYLKIGKRKGKKSAKKVKPEAKGSKKNKESKKQKSGKKAKKGAEGEFEEEGVARGGAEVAGPEGDGPIRLTPRPQVTLRPEDATAAAYAAKVAEAAARRAARAAKRPPAPRRKPQEPLVRERLCSPPFDKKARKVWDVKPATLEERLRPQPTGAWIDSHNEERATRMRKSDIAQAYRPTVKQIRVCTPKEVRVLFTPPPPPPPGLMAPKGSAFTRAIKWLLLTGAKSTLVAFIIWMTAEAGIWDKSDSAAELFYALKAKTTGKLPHASSVTYSLPESWNTGVRWTFYLLGHLIPEFTNRAVRRVRTATSEQGTLETAGA